MSATFELHWTKGSPETLRAGIEQWVEDMSSRARALLRGFAAEGADIMRERIMEETTRTGWQRVEEAGQAADEGFDVGEVYPGRYVTGNMYHAVDDTFDFDPDSGAFAARFGWVEEVEQYFIDQEYGLTANGSKIPKMHALQNAFVAVREKMASEFADKMASGDVTPEEDIAF